VSAKLVIFWHVTMMAFFFPSLVSMGLFNLAWGWSFIRTPKCTSKGGRISGGECVTREFCSDDGHALADGWSLKKKKNSRGTQDPSCTCYQRDGHWRCYHKKPEKPENREPNDTGAHSGTAQHRRLARRLRTRNMDVDSLMAILQELETLQWKFPGMIYHGRSVEIKATTGGTFLQSFGSIIDNIAKVSSPFYHHELLFPLGFNGTVANAVTDVFGITNASSFLVIDLQRDGLEAQVVQEDPPKESNSYTFIGAVHPSWIIPTLKAASQNPYHIYHWNCHSFAVHFFTEMRRACRANGVSRYSS